MVEYTVQHHADTSVMGLFNQQLHGLLIPESRIDFPVICRIIFIT